jgi:hypothetical protein
MRSRGIFRAAMKTSAAVFFLVLSFLFLSAGAARAGVREELDEARTAFYRYEYQAALSLYLPLARLGESQAQEKVGEMYLYGMGVFRDCDRARDWLDKAANQKNPRAAWLMGRIYDDGKCVNKNNLQAYMWYSVAAGMVPRPSRKAGPDDYDATIYPLPAKHADKNEEANRHLLQLIETDQKVLGEAMTRDQIAEAAQRAQDWKPRAQ